MNKILIPLLCIISFTTIHAQIHEIGIFFGGSNYIGDVGVTTYIYPNELASGLLYKWNRSPRHSFRFAYTQSRISSNDADSKEVARYQRGYSFSNKIREISAGLEFNFLNFNLHDYKNKTTPYIYSGLCYFVYDDKYLNSNLIMTGGKSSSMAIPITLGIKSNITKDMIFGIEVGARYTFTDNIDGSNPSNSSLPKFGNINNNDWYVFSGLTLTYTFGDKPCYCSE